MSKTIKLDAPEHIEKMTISGRKHNERLSVIPKHINDEQTGERRTQPEAVKAISKIHNERFVSLKDQVENVKEVCTEYLVNAFKDDPIKFRTSKEFGEEVDGRFDRKGFKSFYNYLIQGLGYPHDSLEALLAELLFYIDVMQAEEATIDLRLEYAVKFGELRFKIFNLFIPESKVQSEKGQKHRTPEIITSIFNELHEIKTTEDIKPRVLWDKFIAILNNDCKDKVDHVKESGNTHNAQSLKVEFTVFPLEGEEGLPSNHKYNYVQFTRKLNRVK